MKLALFTFSLLLSATHAHAVNNAVNLACKALCNSENDCVRRCVGQAELFELRPEFINAVTDWTKKPDDRMRALRSGANQEILDLCKQTGWSLDNMMICLRSYPTFDVIRNCKKLSPLQEEQVRCVRMGKTDAEIESCSKLFPGSDRRLECLSRNVVASDIDHCRHYGDTAAKARCLEAAEAVRSGEARPGDFDDRRPASFSY